jgi:cobalt-zinc-cadmium efflux system outer membrane protein
MPVSTVRAFLVCALVPLLTPCAARAQGRAFEVRSLAQGRGTGDRSTDSVLPRETAPSPSPNSAIVHPPEPGLEVRALEGSRPPAAGSPNLEPGDVTVLGTPGGLTLDAAIDLAIKNNLDLQAKSFEIPQSQADILNAGLRANPIFYADGQLIPYGQFTRAAPGGQTQYDVNVTLPIDVSHKRLARVDLATRAKRVIEAQYQNAVRLRIDEVYSAYVDVLFAFQTVIYMDKTVKGLEAVHSKTAKLYEKGDRTRADLNRIEIQREEARIALFDGQEQLRNRKRILGTLLNLPSVEAETLQVRGTLKDLGPPPPPLDDLIGLALENRPDIAAYQLGVQSAASNVKLQKANRFSDVYLLYQPFTYQNNQPYGLKSPTSWAVGLTVSLPIYNRNQGGILRAELNVTQSQLDLANLEREVVTQVVNAFKEYHVTLQMIQRSEEKVLPRAMQMRDDTEQLFVRGELTAIEFELARRDFNDAAKQFLDAVARHRRSMLTLNTAIGRRILP